MISASLEGNPGLTLCDLGRREEGVAGNLLHFAWDQSLPRISRRVVVWVKAAEEIHDGHARVVER